MFTPQKPVISVFSLIMINIIAVDSLRSLSIGAEYNYSLIFFYTIALITFLLPVALVTAELATTWPCMGGLYIWIREAFGKRWAFITIWLQWIYNVIWYPTLLAFLTATAFYIYDPQLVNNKMVMASAIILLFWGATFLNCFGMRLSSWISTVGSLIGTLLPMGMLMGLSLYWILFKPNYPYTYSTFSSPINTMHNLSFFTAILFGLMGLEMSATHAESVKEPRKNYPRALFISTFIIYFSLIGASLAIVLIIPPERLDLVTGLMDTFHIFFSTLHLEKLTIVLALCIILGSFSSMSAWIIGPTKGLLVAANDGLLPMALQKTNRYDVPVRILMIQGVIVTILSFIFLLMPTISSSYWLLTALTAQLAMIVYLIMFAAAIRLRYLKGDVPRPYRIPGKQWGIWFWASLGSLTCVLAIALGFLPPSNIQVGSVFFFESFLVGGILISGLIPWLWFLFNDKNKINLL